MAIRRFSWEIGILSRARVVLWAAMSLPLFVASSVTQPALADPVSDAAENATIDAAEQYKACLVLAQRRPDQGIESAVAWEKQGGGDPARHCKALALINNDRPEDGALELERIAQTLPADKASMAADLFGQAGQAWIKAGKPQLALHDQDEGLKVQPKNIDLLIDRALNYGTSGMYGEAIADLTAAAAIDQGKPEIYAMRAAAYRHQGDKAAATKDVDAALKLSPDFPLALLERGKLRLLGGDKEGARQDWLHLAKKAPNTPAADEAQRDMQQLDVKADSAPAQ